MAIRQAREADFMSCVNIAKRAWPTFHERESIYHLFCKFFSPTSFVSEEAEAINGFLLGFIAQADQSVAYIHLVAVDPQSQRRGIAMRLYQQFFDAAHRLGAHTVRLIVNPDNKESLAFHQAMDFHPDLHGDTVVVDGVTAIRDYNGPGLHMVPFVRGIP